MEIPEAPPTRRPVLSAPVQGALYMVAAGFGFSIMNALIRVLAEDLEPLQIAFFRNAFALLFMLPWLWRTGGKGLQTKRLGQHFSRALIGLTAMILWFYSLALLPLAEAVALNFTIPLFVTIGAALFLGEVVRARRWSATLIGFLGVLIIVRPGFVEISPAMALPIVAAVIMAVGALLVKSLSDTEAPAAIVLYMNLILTPLSLVPALFVWRWPTAESWLLIVLLGFLAATAHLALTRAYVRAEASAIMPFDYLRLPFVAAIGYFAFNEVPDAWTWTGGAVIAGSAIYIAHREAQVARQRRVTGGAGHAPQGRA